VSDDSAQTQNLVLTIGIAPSDLIGISATCLTDFTATGKSLIIGFSIGIAQDAELKIFTHYADPRTLAAGAEISLAF